MSHTEKLALGVEKYLAGAPCTRAAMEVGLTYHALYDHLRFRNLNRPISQAFTKVPDPTPEEVAERAAAIRDSWSVEECSRRWVGARHGRTYRKTARGYERCA
jgi:hypothetical protein